MHRYHATHLDMACLWGSESCGVQQVHTLDSVVPRPVWVYNRTICTGLGDRVGAMLTVATLAYIANVDIEIQWCGDPQHTYAQINVFIPRWKGYNMPLAEFKKMFTIPANIRLVEQFTSNGSYSVSYTGNELPAEESLDQVYTLASRTTRLLKMVARDDFIRAYHVVGSQFASQSPSPVRYDYVVLHMRALDRNTYDWGEWNPSSYCTRKVLQSLLRHGYPVRVISNNVEWANEALYPLNDTDGLTFSDTSAYQGMSLMLNALGIVQHAQQGYSSYSSVPSMAHGVPLLSTYKGSKHRYIMYSELGEVPPEFHTCGQRKGFLMLLASRVGLA